MRINHNMMAANASRSLGINTNKQTKSLEKLSSGLSINRAADNAAGLSISEKMRSQIAGLSQASSNAEDGVSYLQTAEGAMNEVSSMLVRMEELTTQRANGTYANDDQNNINLELGELQGEIKNIITTTNFNGKSIDGSLKVCLSDDSTNTTEIGIAGTVTTQAAAAGTFTVADGKAGNGTVAGDLTINGTAVTLAATDDTQAEVQAAVNAKMGAGLYLVGTVISGGAIEITHAGAFAAGKSGAEATALTNSKFSTTLADTATGKQTVLAIGDKSITIAASDAASDVSTKLTAASISGFTVADGGSGTIVLTNGSAFTSGSMTSTLNADGTVSGTISGGAAITALGSGATTVAASSITSTLVKSAITEINSVRATFGAQQNKLESVVNNLSTTTENLQSAESRIRDTDMASEMANFNKYNILLQASTSMLSQANSAPQTILSLFR